MLHNYHTVQYFLHDQFSSLTCFKQGFFKQNETVLIWLKIYLKCHILELKPQKLSGGGPPDPHPARGRSDTPIALSPRARSGPLGPGPSGTAKLSLKKKPTG